MEQDRSISESVLNASFEAHWSYFENVIAEAREVLKRNKQETPSPRTTTEMFEEIIVSFAFFGFTLWSGASALG